MHLLDLIVDGVEVPSAPIVTSEDLSVPIIAEPSSIRWRATYTLVRTALKTIDYALNICEKVAKVNASRGTKYAQKLISFNKKNKTTKGVNVW